MLPDIDPVLYFVDFNAKQLTYELLSQNILKDTCIISGPSTQLPLKSI